MEIVEPMQAGRAAEIEDEAEFEHPIARIACKLRDIGMHLFFFLPVVYSPSVTASLFEVPKATALALFTVLTTTSGLAYVLLRGHYRLHRTAVDIPLLALLVVSLLSTIFSVAPLLSLYGEYARRDGLLTLANYALLYFMAVSYFTSWHSIRRAAEILVLVAAFVSLVGLLESQGLALHGEFAAATFGGRVFSTVGNPDFLGAYMVLIAPTAIGLLMTARLRGMKLLWAIAFLLIAACLIATMTRGAWIGFAASLLILVPFARSLRPHAIWLIGLLVILVVASAGLGTSTSMPRGAAAQPNSADPTAPAAALPAPSPSLLDRLTSMADLKSGTVQVRFETWKQALSILRDHPLLGTGLNTFQMVATRYFSPDYARGEGADYMPDRPHNQYLQWAAFAGVPGLLAYLAVLGAVLWCWARWLWRNPSHPRRLLLIGILAGWGGYLMQNFFLFDTIMTAPQFWLLTAVGVAITRPSTRYVQLWTSRRSSWIIWPTVGALVLVAAGVSFLGVRPLVADVLFRQGQAGLHSAGTGHDPSAGYASMEESIRWMPHEQYYRHMYALTVLGKVVSSGLADSERQRDLSTALKVITPAIDDNRWHANLYFTRGAIYDELGRLADAYRDYRRAAELHPYDRASNLALARTARQMGRVTESIAAERRVLALYPNRVSTLSDLTQDLLAVRAVAEAQQLVERLTQLAPDDPFVPFLQGEVYEVKGDWRNAVAQYNAALERKADLKPALDGLERVRRKAPPSEILERP